MGSLLPLSSSSKGRRLFFRCRPLERSIEKTEAESVEAMVEANNMEVSKPTPAAGIVMPSTHQTNTPVIRAVKKTPMVASTTPCAYTGLISEMRVSKPPENRMMHSATVPIVCAN